MPAQRMHRRTPGLVYGEQTWPRALAMIAPSALSHYSYHEMPHSQGRTAVDSFCLLPCCCDTCSPAYCTWLALPDETRSPASALSTGDDEEQPGADKRNANANAHARCRSIAQTGSQSAIWAWSIVAAPCNTRLVRSIQKSLRLGPANDVMPLQNPRSGAVTDAHLSRLFSNRTADGVRYPHRARRNRSRSSAQRGREREGPLLKRNRHVALVASIAAHCTLDSATREACPKWKAHLVTSITSGRGRAQQAAAGYAQHYRQYLEKTSSPSSTEVIVAALAPASSI